MTAAVTVLEVWTGLELLRPSRRRTQLDSAFDQLLQEDLDGRVLAFDSAAANAAGIAVAAARRRGRPVETSDRCRSMPVVLPSQSNQRATQYHLLSKPAGQGA